MSLVFGWYSFKIKSYAAKDLELDIDEWKESNFEVRQKVFHLFWIPFFSLGKFYALRRQGKLYDLPQNIITIVRSKGKIRTPWYSFLLPILLIVVPVIVGIFIYIAESVMKYNHYKEDKRLYEIAIHDIQYQLNKLSKNAYLRIANPERPNEEKTVLKLIDINNEKYSFIAKKINFPKYSNEKYLFENLSMDTLIFTRNQLQQALCTNYDIIDQHKPYGINFLGDDKYIIENIEYFDEPVIEGNIDWYFWDVIKRRKFQYYNTRFTGYKKERSWSFKIIFQNFGIPVNLIKIQNIEDEVQWVDTLPMKINSYEYLKDYYVEVNTSIDPKTVKFKTKFTFEDSLKNKYEYIVTGDKSWYEINRKKD